MKRGADPLDVYPGKHWLIVAGHQDEDGVLSAERLEGSSKSQASHFFTGDDELLQSGDKTWAVTKMWGEQTLTVVNGIVRRFGMDDVSYEAIE